MQRVAKVEANKVEVVRKQECLVVKVESEGSIRETKTQLDELLRRWQVLRKKTVKAAKHITIERWVGFRRGILEGVAV